MTRQTTRTVCFLLAWLFAATLVGQIPESPAPEPVPSSRLAELELRNGELERQLAASSRELERYRAALERAVAELNRRRRRRLPAGGRILQPDQSSSSPAAALHPSSFLWSNPEVRLEGRLAVVEGELRNSGADAAKGTLTVELFRDGEPIDRARYSVEVPPRSRLPYVHRFTIRGWGAGNYDARAYVHP